MKQNKPAKYCNGKREGVIEWVSEKVSSKEVSNSSKKRSNAFGDIVYLLGSALLQLSQKTVGGLCPSLI